MSYFVSGDDIEFSFDINHIIKYKRGECLYILKNLTRTITTYDKQTYKPRFDPILHFTHATKSSNYDYQFKKGEVFSDRFEYVEWDTLSKSVMREIIGFNNFDNQVNDALRRSKDFINSPRFAEHLIDERIREIGQLGGGIGYGKKEKVDTTFRNGGNLVDQSGYGVIGMGDMGIVVNDCVPNTLTISDGSTHLYSSGITSCFFSQEEKVNEEDTFEPIVLRRKKNKRHRLVTLNVEKPRILK
jgi:hypothetical protein